jgi:hypothetical protein
MVHQMFAKEVFMQRSFIPALALVAASVANVSWCRETEPQSLMTSITEWQYPGSKIGKASLSDAATVDTDGRRTVPSVQYKTVLTTKAPMKKVIQFYDAKLKPKEKPASEVVGQAADSGRSVTIHDDSENRPVSIHVIAVNSENESVTLVISRAQNEPETHIAWTRYVRFKVGKL